MTVGSLISCLTRTIPLYLSLHCHLLLYDLKSRQRPCRVGGVIGHVLHSSSIVKT